MTSTLGCDRDPELFILNPDAAMEGGGLRYIPEDVTRVTQPSAQGLQQYLQVEKLITDTSDICKLQQLETASETALLRGCYIPMLYWPPLILKLELETFCRK